MKVKIHTQRGNGGTKRERKKGGKEEGINKGREREEKSMYVCQMQNTLR